MSSILSTKRLMPSQKELLLNAKQSFIEYNAINIEFLDFEVETTFNYLVFTSQNGVKSFLKYSAALCTDKQKAFCVGEKTKIVLEENGIKVIEVAQNSSDLGQIIAKKYQKGSFLIVSGNLRRPELVGELSKNNIRYKEVVAYNTLLNYKKFDRHFDGVLFFSPSGVQSFIKQNQLQQAWAFCIGETTAKEVKKYTNNIVIANRPTVENVLVQAIKHFDSHLHGKDKH